MLIDGGGEGYLRRGLILVLGKFNPLCPLCCSTERARTQTTQTIEHVRLMLLMVAVGVSHHHHQRKVVSAVLSRRRRPTQSNTG